jgi:hypothetical protein
MIKLKNILAENMRRFNTKNLNEQTSTPRDLEKILVKNFYKFKFPTKLDRIENVWMPAFATVDNSFQDLGLDVEATKAEYTNWLQKNGFRPTDIYIDQQNIDSVQKQILAKRFK